MKAEATAYAERGLHTLALYGITLDGCACAKATCKSPGKHPFERLSPHGALDPYRDPDWIRANWPEEDAHLNLGIAMAGGYYVFDVDDPATAQMLRDPDLQLADETALATTGRGLHIWIHSEKDVGSFVVKNDKGEKIGDFIAKGKYVVAPPSKHITGVQREWLGFVDGPMPKVVTVADPVEYVRQTLASVGVTMEDEPDYDMGASTFDGQPVAVMDIPDTLLESPRTFDVRRKLTMPELAAERDRSGSLWSDVCSVYEESVRQGEPLDVPTLAGITRRIDQAAYRKYTQRVDAAERYWRTAERAIRASSKAAPGPQSAPQAATGGAQPANGAAVGDDADEMPFDGVWEGDDLEMGAAATPSPPPSASPYFWDEASGTLFKIPDDPRKKSIRIANFNPRIRRDYLRPDGSHVVAIELVLKGGKSAVATFAGRDMEKLERQAFISWFGSDYIIEPGKRQDVIAAMQYLSRGQIDTGTVPNRTGWVEDRDGLAFVMPGMDYAIKSDRLDPTLKISADILPKKETILSSAYANYGLGVRPPVDDAEMTAACEAFRLLMESAAPHVIGPALLGALGGPLRSGPLAASPPLVHLRGSTGSFKTTMALLVISLYGPFGVRYGRERRVPMSWASTPKSLSLGLHALKDLPIVIDDYKVSSKRKEKADLINLIQTYGDESTRSRMTGDQELHEQLVASALFMSTGEQVWADDPAMMARTICVSVKPGDVHLDTVTQVQTMIRQGHLQHFGAMWLQYLAGRPDMVTGQWGSDRRAKYERQLEAKIAQMPDAHRRILETASGLLLVGDVLTEFLAARAPQLGDSAQRFVRAARRAILALVMDTVGSVRAESPARRLYLAMTAATAQSAAYLRHRRAHKCPADAIRRPNMADARNGNCIGFYDHDAGGGILLYFTRDVTYKWLSEWYRKEDIAFDWNSLMEDLKALGGTHKEEWFYDYNYSRTRNPQAGHQTRTVVIPQARLAEACAE